MDIFNEERTAPTAPFRAVALTGNVLRHGVPTRDGGRETLEFVVDLATVAPTRTPLVVDYNHDPAEIVGAARVRADGFALLADGELTPFLSDDRASEIISKAARGVPYGISPTFDFAAAERVDVGPGETFEANGRQYVGPVVVFRNAPLLGLSVCPYPTDDGTAFALLGKDFTLLTKGNEMAEEKDEKTTELKDDAANAPDGEGATGTSDAPSSVKNAELQEYVDRFGLELGVKYFQEGADLAEATSNAFQALKEENEKLKSRLANDGGDGDAPKPDDDKKDGEKNSDAPKSGSDGDGGELAKLRAALEKTSRELTTLRRDFATFAAADRDGVSTADESASRSKTESYREAFKRAVGG
ncbi:MAG: hypothetical protein J6K20_06540 [Thermoguttaceae bacterium]|nr:hypothetical protein [Thermoguttaceae bacterium]